MTQTNTPLTSNPATVSFCSESAAKLDKDTRVSLHPLDAEVVVASLLKPEFDQTDD